MKITQLQNWVRTGYFSAEKTVLKFPVVFLIWWVFFAPTCQLLAWKLENIKEVMQLALGQKGKT